MKPFNSLGIGLLGMVMGAWIAAVDARTQEGWLELALGAAADYSPVYPTRTVPATARELTAVFRLGEGEAYRTLTGTWIAVDVGDVAPPNYEIATTDLRANGAGDRGRFRYEQPGPLPVGRYRLDVAADGRPWRSVEFIVVPGTPDVDVPGPDGLLPLTPGRSWTYAFVQEPGEGATVSMPGVRPDAEGRLRASVTLTVLGGEDAGTHVEWRRNGVQALEEWWRLSPSGLVATRRKPGDEIIDLDPPQLLLPFPLAAPQSWTYEAADGSSAQSNQVWGPVPVAGPDGNAPGYIVLTKEPPQSPVVSAERHFLPGVGLVREVIVQALDGRTVSRTEMVLEAGPTDGSGE